MFKKNIHWMVLFLIIAIISIFSIISISKSFSMDLLINQIHTANIFWLFLAFIAMAGFIVFEAFALRVLIKGLSNKDTSYKSLTYSASDIYFSAITPSATGGQPASAFFMIKDGIPGAKVTVILLLNLILYTFALLFCGIIVFIFQTFIFIEYDLIPKLFIIAGMIALVGMALIFGMLLKYENIICSIASWFIRIGGKFKIVKNIDKKISKLQESMKQYKECANEINGKYKMLFWGFLFNLLQRISQSLVTVFCYLALHGNISNAFHIWSIQIYTIVGSNSVPIPGSIGVVDYLLVKGLNSINDVMSAANLELLSRGISFYSCLILSIVITIIGYILRLRKDGE